MKFSHFAALLAPHMEENMSLAGSTYEAVTLLGLQCRLLANLDYANALFVYENCSFKICSGYDELNTLENNGLRMVPKIFQEVTKSRLSAGGMPNLHIVRDPIVRKQIAREYLEATIAFHRVNNATVLWCQGLAWASLSFLEWIQMDRCFPIAYMLSTSFSNGKSTAMNALALSIGLSPEAMGGNKTSESGFLDWTNSCCGLAYFLDDFNAKSVNQSKDQNTWKELFKQLHDANSVNQHDKFRLVLSAIFLSANTELCPWDGPLQSRLFTAVFATNVTDVNDTIATENYNKIMKVTSCLVPDIIAWRHKQKLDAKYITELQRFIELIAAPMNLPKRLFQHLKKPMYYLCLMAQYVGCLEAFYEVIIIKHLVEAVLPRYGQYCTHVDMWQKFFYYFQKCQLQCNKRSSDPTQSIHW